MQLKRAVLWCQGVACPHCSGLPTSAQTVCFHTLEHLAPEHRDYLCDFFPIQSETARWLCHREWCFNIRRIRVVYTPATEIQFGMMKIKHYAIQKTGVRGCHSLTRLVFPPLPPSQKETLPGSLQARGELQSWCKRSAGPRGLCGCASVEVPAAGQSKRSRVVSLNVEIPDYYALEISPNGNRGVFQLNVVLHDDFHSRLPPSDIYRSCY